MIVEITRAQLAELLTGHKTVVEHVTVRVADAPAVLQGANEPAPKRWLEPHEWPSPLTPDPAPPRADAPIFYMRAKFRGRCHSCKKFLAAGFTIMRDTRPVTNGDKAVHLCVDCGKREHPSVPLPGAQTPELPAA